MQKHSRKCAQEEMIRILLLIRMMKKSWKQIAVMAAQPCEYTLKKKKECFKTPYNFQEQTH